MEIETKIKRRQKLVEEDYKTAEEKTDIFEEEKKKIFEREEW